MPNDSKAAQVHTSRIGNTGMIICSCGWSFRSNKRNGYAIANQRNSAFAKHLQEVAIRSLKGKNHA